MTKTEEKIEEKEKLEKYPKLSRTDSAILNELCKNSGQYLKIDVTKLAKNTKLARNTVSVRIEKLLKEHMLKLIAAENFELEAYEGMFCMLKFKTTTKREVFDDVINALKKEKIVENVWGLFGHEKVRKVIAFNVRYLSPFRLVGTKTYMRGRMVTTGGVLYKIIEKFFPDVDQIESYYMHDTPKLLFHHKFTNYDIVTGEIKP